MDLYFHRTPSPKQQRQKSFLGDKLVSITWKNQILEKKPFLVHNTVTPQETSQKKTMPNQHHFVDYIQQQKITVTKQAKKLWKQWHSNDQLASIHSSNSSKNNSHCSSILLFDSSEHETLSTLSFHMDNDNKRSYTDPNLMTHQQIDEEEEEEGEEEDKKKKKKKQTSLIKDYRLFTRALPNLPFPSYPSSFNGNALKKKVTITRATTWVGRSIQKWITTEEQRKIAILLDDSELEDSMLDEQIPDSSIYNNKGSQKIIDDTKKMVLSCKVLQISNLTSSKAYEYDMTINMGDSQVLGHKGCLKKVFKGVSADNPYASFSVDIEGPFKLECQFNIKPYLTSRSRLVKKIIYKEIHHDEQDSTIKGRLVLNSGDKILSSFANKGISRFTIETTSTPLELEMTAVFCLEEKKEEQVSSNLHIDNNIKRYCEAGDYLTFYIRTDSCPMWVRYWATFENNYLVIRSNERGEPVERFSLDSLKGIDTNPSDDVLEEIYLGKRYVMTLIFHHDQKMYLFGDNYTSICYWKSMLQQNRSSSIQKKAHVIQKRYFW